MILHFVSMHSISSTIVLCSIWPASSSTTVDTTTFYPGSANISSISVNSTTQENVSFDETEGDDRETKMGQPPDDSVEEFMTESELNEYMSPWVLDEKRRQLFQMLGMTDTGPNTELTVNQLMPFLEASGFDSKSLPVQKIKHKVSVGVSVLIEQIDELTTSDFSGIVMLMLDWDDFRLAHNFLPIRAMFSDDINKLWVPPIIISNAANGELGNVARDNHAIEVLPEGKVIYRARYEVKAVCRMHFELYPFDTQLCGLDIQTFGYRYKTLKLGWSSAGIIQNNLESFHDLYEGADTDNVTAAAYVNKRIDFVQFDLLGVMASPEFEVTQMGSQVSMVQFRMVLQRNFMFSALYIFVPSFLLVIVSYLTLWLDPTAIMPRIAMNITVLLTLQTLAGHMSRSLPKVSYFKAIDLWMLGCNMFATAALIEFVIVNYIFRDNFQIQWKNTFKNGVAIDSRPKSKEHPRRDGNPKVAVMLDQMCRLLFAATFICFSFGYLYYHLSGDLELDAYDSETATFN